MSTAQQLDGMAGMALDSENAPGGIVVYYADGDEEIIHVNQYVIDLFECDSFEDFMAHVGGSFRGFVHHEDVSTAEDSIWGQVGEQDNLDHIYYRVMTKSGKLVNIDDYGRLVKRPGQRPVFYVFVVEVQDWGAVDWLTGLSSMSRFRNLATFHASEMRKRGEAPIAIALDLTDFKGFNGEYGHDEGDALLKYLADLLRKYFGNEGCSRFAEDHFYAIASGADVENKIERLFDDFRSAHHGKVPTLRVGLYECADEDDFGTTGIDCAKYACDLDKKTWMSHAVWFSDEMALEAGMRSYVLEHFDEAIEKRWLRPYYQAIIRTSTGHICGEEALARWVDPVRGLLTPDKFIPVLEEAGLLPELDLHIIDCVFDDFITKRDAGIPLAPVSVNISLHDLGKLNLAVEIVKRADAVGLPHNLVRVEFTESAPSRNPDAVRSQMEALHEAGIDVWMDDFGSGYSSLNILERFDFDLIKLDMELISNIHSEKTLGIVAGIIESARKLGIATLAEGVESEEQDLFLSKVGCDMIQGFLYAKGNPIEFVLERFREKKQIPRENTAELDYWNKLGLFDLDDPISYVNESASGETDASQAPSGIIEKRNGQWRLVRANEAFKEFLNAGGVLENPHARFASPVFERIADADFTNATSRARQTGNWERIAGRLEHGTGLQFYVSFIAETQGAESYGIASVPTMLGTALGTYGDVPVSYAVLKVVLSEAKDSVEDVEYVYANADYCRYLGIPQEGISGRSFRNSVQNANAVWFPYCYRAAALKQTVHDIIFAPEIGHWISMNIAPSPIEDCCTFAYTIADDEHRERDMMIAGLDTSDRIIKIMSDFDREKDYETAMNGVLEAMSEVVHPDRLCIYERGDEFTRNTFEWCAPGVKPQIHTLQHMDNRDLKIWDDRATTSNVSMIANVEAVKDFDEFTYDQLVRQGIKSTILVRLYAEGKIIGYLSADNFVLEEGFDTRRLLEVASSSIAARIVNQRLMSMLEQTGTHDGLTGLLNRRGIDAAIDEALAADPVAPYVLALIDVDDFKLMNDLHGHAVGDEALRVLSNMLANAFDQNAIIGRNGGDEFLVMLFGADVQRADELLSQLSESELMFDFGDRRYRLSISIGYVEYPAQSASLKESYSKADAALYDVKLSGKFGHSRYTAEAESNFRSLLGFSSRALTENLPGGILVFRADGSSSILFANEELVRMLECTSLLDLMEFSGTVADNLIVSQDRAHVLDQLAHQRDFENTDAKMRLSYHIATKSGKTMHVVANSRLIEMDNIGEVYYLNILEA